jgi:molecular chaperone Hsp33
MSLETSAPDLVRRFMVENRPVRGHWVRIASAWRALREHQAHSAPVRELLGQAVSASVLLASTLKFRGTLTLQLHGDGAVRMLVAQCTHEFGVRALVRLEEDVPGLALAAAGAGTGLTPEVFRRLVGAEGRIVVTIEAAERGQRYQGIVPLAGRSLAECLETYFASSEQLPTRVRLAANDAYAAGVLIQKLPEASAGETIDGIESAWAEAQRGMVSVDRLELLSAPIEQVLARNFGGRDLRLFGGTPVRFECRCDPERVESLLRALGQDEVRDVLREQGAVTVTCDFCNRPYRFEAVDVERLFVSGAVPRGPPSLH